jgi:hypothetical protein
MEEMANIVPTAVFVMGQPSAQTDRVSDAVLSPCRQPEGRAWTDAAVSSRDAQSQGSRGAEPW